MGQKQNLTITNIYSWDEPQPINATTLFEHIDLRNSLILARTAVEGVVATFLSPVLWLGMWRDLFVTMGIIPAVVHILPLAYDTP